MENLEKQEVQGKGADRQTKQMISLAKFVAVCLKIFAAVIFSTAIMCSIIFAFVFESWNFLSSLILLFGGAVAALGILSMACILDMLVIINDKL